MGINLSFLFLPAMGLIMSFAFFAIVLGRLNIRNYIDFDSTQMVFNGQI